VSESWGKKYVWFLFDKYCMQQKTERGTYMRKIFSLLQVEARRGYPPLLPNDSVVELRDNVDFIKSILRSFLNVIHPLGMNHCITSAILDEARSKELFDKFLNGYHVEYREVMLRMLSKKSEKRNDPAFLRELIYTIIPGYSVDDPFWNDTVVPIQHAVYAKWIFGVSTRLVCREYAEQPSLMFVDRMGCEDTIALPNTFIGTILCRKAVLTILLIGKTDKSLPKDVWTLLAKYLYLTRREECWFI
jgi:hypothetical protein